MEDTIMLLQPSLLPNDVLHVCLIQILLHTFLSTPVHAPLTCPLLMSAMFLAALMAASTTSTAISIMIMKRIILKFKNGQFELFDRRKTVPYWLLQHLVGPSLKQTLLFTQNTHM